MTTRRWTHDRYNSKRKHGSKRTLQRHIARFWWSFR
jgi:hypothetical protein